MVCGSLLAAASVTGALVFTGKLTLPLVAQRLVQDYVPVTAPEFHIGDVSTYQFFFSDGNSAKFNLRYKVTSIDENRITFRYDGSQISPDTRIVDEDTLLHSRRPNEVEIEYGDGDDMVELALLGLGLPDAMQFGYEFPLHTGKTWQEKFTMTSKGQGRKKNRAAKLLITGQVLGWERDIGHLDGVMVDGLKLRIDITSDVLEADGSRGATWTTTRTQWYVPAARQSAVIRSVSHSKDLNARFLSTQHLTNFIPTGITDTE